MFRRTYGLEVKKKYQDQDVTEEVGTLLDKKDNHFMKSNLFNITKEDVKGALISACFMAFVAVLIYIHELGSIWAIDWKDLANVGIMAGIVYLISVCKNFLTTADGKFLGLVKWK